MTTDPFADAARAEAGRRWRDPALDHDPIGMAVGLALWARDHLAAHDEWRQTALDERGAALDALEQVKARDARIKAVRNVLDEAAASINHHPAYTFSGQRMDPIVNGADIRRALDGEA